MSNIIQFIPQDKYYDYILCPYCNYSMFKVTLHLKTNNNFESYFILKSHIRQTRIELKEVLEDIIINPDLPFISPYVPVDNILIPNVYNFIAKIKDINLFYITYIQCENQKCGTMVFNNDRGIYKVKKIKTKTSSIEKELNKLSTKELQKMKERMEKL